MDNNIASAKAEKIATPIQRPVQAVPPVNAKVNVPPPLMVPEKNIHRGMAVNIEAPEGTPGVQPTLMEKTSAEDLIPTDPWETSPMFHELAQYFNIDPKFYNSTKDKISVITDWAITQAGSNKIEDIFSTIRGIEDNLYRPGFDETRLDVLYKYLRLASQKSAVEKALRAYERGPMSNGNASR